MQSLQAQFHNTQLFENSLQYGSSETKKIPLRPMQLFHLFQEDLKRTHENSHQENEPTRKSKLNLISMRLLKIIFCHFFF